MVKKFSKKNLPISSGYNQPRSDPGVGSGVKIFLWFSPIVEFSKILSTLSIDT